MRRIFPILFALMFLFSFFASAEGPGFHMDPILVERVVRGGQTTSYTIYLENQDRFNSLTVSLKAADIRESLDGAYHLEPLGTTPYSLQGWIVLDREQVTIPPGGTASVQVTINVPRGYSGGRYGAVVVGTVPEEKVSSEEAIGASTFIFQTASFIELQIADGRTRVEAYPAFFDIGPSKDYPSLKARVGDDALVFAVGVENKGNIHIVTRGTLIIRTMEGRTVSRYPLGGGRGVILPETTVALRSVLTQPLPPGDYIARATVDFGGRRPVVSETTFRVEEEGISFEEMRPEEPLSRFLVEPDEIEMSLTPGAFRSFVLQVTNRGDEPITLEGELFPLEFDIYGELASAVEPLEDFWLEIVPSEFTLNPGQTRRIRLNVRPPRELTGSFYLDLVFRGGDGIITTETGSNLLVLVGDDFKKEGKISNVKMEQKEDAIMVDLFFQNTGNTHLDTSVEIVLNRHFPQEEGEDGLIIGARTERVESVEIPSGENPVLPGKERLFTFFIPSALEVGKYEILARVDYGGEEPAITRIPFVIEGGKEN